MSQNRNTMVVRKDILKQNQYQESKTCGVRDSNPRTPARQDLKSCAFGQLGKPRANSATHSGNWML